MVSLSDVAKAAGVSVTTASFVLNGHVEDKRISPQTAERVLRAVRELGYVPNVAARKLISSGNRKLIPDIAVMWSPDTHHSFIGTFITNAQIFFEQEAVPEMRITIAPYAMGPIQNSNLNILHRQYNGAVFSPSYDEDFSYIENFNPRIPLVVLHLETDHHPNVVIDNYGTGRLAAEIFAKRGHRSATMLFRDKIGASSMPDLRYSGFVDACCANGMAFSGSLIPLKKMATVTSRSVYGQAQAKHYLQTKTLPEAVFIQDDAIAMGFAIALLSAGVRYPDDIEIITYGNDSLVSALHPSITTLDYPIAAITLETLKLLAQQLGDPYASPRRITVMPGVTFRGSCPKPDSWDR